MGKKKDKISSRKLHKYDYIDNNYLTFDRNITNSMIMCGLATGISCLFFGILPFAVILYLMSVLERSQRYINQSVFSLVMCGVAIVGSLVTSIIAKIKYRKSKWAVMNIVYISINIVVSGLISWFFIWLINSYGP